MNSGLPPPDPAAIFGAAKSLFEACHDYAASHPEFNLSDAHNGIDQLMREVMRIATDFEIWSCAHIDFNQLSDVWPYFLEDQFGPACLHVLHPTDLANYQPDHSLRVAFHLRLPIIHRLGPSESGI